MRTASGVVAGFVVWSVIWLCGNVALRSAGMLPASQSEPIHAAAPVVALLVLSILCSIAAGYTAARVARVPVAAVYLGIALLVVGVAVQVQYWALMPAWYSVAFVLLLVPMTIAGGRMAFGRGAASPATISA